MPIIKYIPGLERTYHIERDDFNNSIFHDSYINALRTISVIIQNEQRKKSEDEKDVLNLLAFCGDRGDGKTSCMMTVRNLLNNLSDKDSKQYKFVVRHCPKLLKNCKFELLRVIDPSLFDTKHNIIDLLTGELYSVFLTKNKDTRNRSFSYQNDIARRNLLQAFEEVRGSLTLLHKSDECPIDQLSELNDLSYNLNLKNSIANMVERFLRYMDRDYLIVSIDDIDLELNNVYEMCQQIQKYLCVPKCIVFIGVKLSQLHTTIKNSMLNSLTIFKNGDVNMEVEEMATKYITKFIPITSRIVMPKPFEIQNLFYEFFNDEESEETFSIYNLAQFIKDNTGYSFSEFSDNPVSIVPNNLRDLVNLIGQLVSMPEVIYNDPEEAKEILNRNKSQFKNYFFSIWTGSFDDKTNKELENLINFDYGSNFNKRIIEFIKRHFDSYLDFDFSSEMVTERFILEEDVDKTENSIFKTKIYDNEIKRSILDVKNFSYNISAGDVLFIISLLEKEVREPNESRLLYFIKQLYSISLEDAVLKDIDHKRIATKILSQTGETLNEYPHNYFTTNNIQRLVNGSYFTYSPGSFIKPLKNTEYLDQRIINGSQLIELASFVKDTIEVAIDRQKNPEKNNNVFLNDFKEKLNLLEFFILTIKGPVDENALKAVSPQNMVNALAKARLSVDSFAFEKIENVNSNFLFDVTAPLANLLNPIFTFLRFPFFEEEDIRKILNFHDSLLFKIITFGIVDQGISNDKKEINNKNLNDSLKSLAIRNTDTYDKILSNIKTGFEHNNSNRLSRLKNFYDSLWEDKEFKIHAGNPSEGYYKFCFSKILSEYLSSVRDTNKENEEIKDFDIFNINFSSIFDSYQNEGDKIKKLLVNWGPGSADKFKSELISLWENISSLKIMRQIFKDEVKTKDNSLNILTNNIIELFINYNYYTGNRDKTITTKQKAIMADMISLLIEKIITKPIRHKDGLIQVIVENWPYLVEKKSEPLF